MAVFTEMSTSPRPGRRNALPNIFEGVSPDTLQRLRHASTEGEGEGEGVETPQRELSPSREEVPVIANGAAQPGSPVADFLDIIHSSRYRQRRNAIANVAETIDRQSLRRQLNNFHTTDSESDGDAGVC